MISEKLLTLRKQKKLTVRELADQAEVTPAMISRFENNKARPGKKVLQKLALALGTTVLELKNGDTEIDGNFDEEQYEDLLSEAKRFPPNQKLAVFNFLQALSKCNHFETTIKNLAASSEHK